MVAILSHLFGCVCYTAKTDTLAALFVVLLAQVSLTVLGSKVFFFFDITENLLLEHRNEATEKTTNESSVQSWD